jgi:transposase
MQDVKCTTVHPKSIAQRTYHHYFTTNALPSEYTQYSSPELISLLHLLLLSTYTPTIVTIAMGKQSTYSDRVTVVALRAYTSKTSQEIAKIVDLSISTVNRIYARAIERGFDPIHTKILDEYVEDSPRTGRPTKQNPETIDNILLKVRLNRFGREKTCADLAGELS